MPPRLKHTQHRKEIQRQRVRQTLTRLTTEQLIERAMQFYEERNTLSDACQRLYIENGIRLAKLEAK